MGWRDNIGKEGRHIVCLSGGKDSSALAVYLRDKIPNLEYVFCDTKMELKETYDYLFKMEQYLGKKIHYLTYQNGYGFEDILKLKGGFLPSPEFRWCTDYLKLKPYDEYIGNDIVYSYVGIRADELTRKGFIPAKKTIRTIFPFIEDNIIKADVFRILEDAGLGVPDYYNWRSRSGCFFCFYQQKREWVGLLENHPDLYWKAASYEKIDPETGVSYTWMQNESLKELARPERVAQIKNEHKKRQEREKNKFISNQRLCDLWNITN